MVLAIPATRPLTARELAEVREIDEIRSVRQIDLT